MNHTRPTLLDVTADSLLDGKHELAGHVELIDGVHYLQCQQIKLTRTIAGAILVSLCDATGKDLVAWSEPWAGQGDILTIRDIQVSMKLEVA
jgi:hypothetical protein